MRALVSFVALLATVSAQAVTDLIVPSATPPAGCLNSRQGTFEILIANATGFGTDSPTPTRRSFDRVRRQNPQGTALTLTLNGGVLLDSQNRTGYIASNYQFQFDGPPQAGAIYTAGWSICSNSSLSLGGNSIFWQCLSGEFYNLYDRNWTSHCYPININTRGNGNIFSTSPPGPEITGPDQNDIANGGGTQIINSTATASASSTSASESATASTTESAVESATSSALEAASSATAAASSAVQSATESAASIASSAFAAHATTIPQQVVAWVAGVVGAAVLL